MQELGTEITMMINQRASIAKKMKKDTDRERRRSEAYAKLKGALPARFFGGKVPRESTLKRPKTPRMHSPTVLGALRILLSTHI